jgi:uncharacterized protein with GYD domain
MPFYLFQWQYKDPAIKAMVNTPQDRPEELRKAVEAFDGCLHQFFFAFGEYDGVSIVEFLNNESCAACAVTLTGAGANTIVRTNVLLTAGEWQSAMRRANSVPHGYRLPVIPTRRLSDSRGLNQAAVRQGGAAGAIIARRR